MTEITKFEKAGHIAIAVTQGYGSGWSTSCDNKQDREFLCMDESIIRLLLKNGPTMEKKLEKIAHSRLGPKFYTGGIRSLAIEWVPKGTMFRISNYDGYEMICVFNESEYFHV